MADIEKAKKRLDNIIFKLWRRDNVMFGALSMLDKIPDPNYDTMGIDVGRTDGVSLRFNPNFVNSVSFERLELVLVIEGFRVLLRHCTTRLRDPRNIAHLGSSLAINQLMNSDLEALIGGLGDLTPSPEVFGLPGQQAYEEYYRGLLEKQEQTDQKIQQIWGQMSDEEKEKAINKMVQQAAGQADQRDQNRDQDNFQRFGSEEEAMKAHTNPNGNANQGWDKNNGFDADVKAFVDRVRNKTRMWGKYTGTAQSEIVACLDPKVSCSDIIRKFNSSILTGKTVPSRMKVNRRWDVERPGYRRVYKPHVIFAVDVSGSMTDSDLAHGFSVVNKLLHHAKLTFVEFDTEIKHVEKNLNKARKSFHVHGRGGTDFEHIMSMADEEDVDGVIVYTDGQASAPHEPKCRVLWLLHAKNAEPPVSWGFKAWLDRFEDYRLF